jgi:uncharacterized membrane protein YdbT with pleckstrin-like domain
MSTYVERILQPGEQVRHFARLHWILYVPSFLVLLASLVMLYLARTMQSGEWIWLSLSAVLAVAAIVMLLRAWFHRWITEIAVTNRRVIYKTGFISRRTNEMQMDKVESVRVDQSIPGRLFDYGDVTVLGTGKGEFTTIRKIAAPLALRNQITGV